MRIHFVLAGILILSAGLRADVIHLKNGRKLEGSVSEGAKKGTLDIRTGEGTVVTITEAEIEKVEKKPSPIDEYESRWKALEPGELEPLSDLLVWARDRQLHSRVRMIARKILEVDPNDELARKELGYVVFENRWILEAELKKKKDLVRFRDEWMTQADKDRRLAQETLREMEDLLSLVGSENPHIQEFALQKLLAYRETAAREVFGSHLRDARDTVRWVAVRGLANFPVTGGGDAVARAMAADLHRLALGETNELGLVVIHYALRRFFPSESARLAQETAQKSPDPLERKRAGEILAKLKSGKDG